MYSQRTAIRLPTYSVTSAASGIAAPTECAFATRGTKNARPSGTSTGAVSTASGSIASAAGTIADGSKHQRSQQTKAAHQIASSHANMRCDIARMVIEWPGWELRAAGSL